MGSPKQFSIDDRRGTPVVHAMSPADTVRFSRPAADFDHSFAAGERAKYRRKKIR